MMDVELYYFISFGIPLVLVHNEYPSNKQKIGCKKYKNPFEITSRRTFFENKMFGFFV